MPEADKSILITGCSSGIGLCAAETLLKRGYRVFATARKAEDVLTLQQAGFTDALQLDLNDSNSIRQAVDEVLKKNNNKLFALFNNGAYQQPGAVEDLSRQALRDNFETNLFGTHELTNLILPVMRQQGYGRVIQNSSILGFIALPYRGAYNASKFALEALTDTLRLEFKLTNATIYISLIEPGPISSSFKQNSYKAFVKNIDSNASFHQQNYLGLEKRLSSKDKKAPFTLTEDAVVEKLLHALESKKPKNRYYVTKPTQWFAVAKRILPAGMLENIILKVAKDELK